ncbi:TPA: hypothetical protein HA318_06285 [Candidatus Micrarchaeota archaeon]|nr:MAG: hypothetical protein AUJ65_04065 [Candidatus Micrarchaeota archaeon CG1_02_51_15]HII39578.1 hypothetical protein [Candidatus Micrarchaeota archaeon]
MFLFYAQFVGALGTTPPDYGEDTVSPICTLPLSFTSLILEYARASLVSSSVDYVLQPAQIRVLASGALCSYKVHLIEGTTSFFWAMP